MWKSTKQIFKISLLMIILMLHSCIVVKEQVSDESDVEELAVLSIKPEIPMSDVILRSNKGDMVSYIPEGWFFIDTEQRSSSDIIAVIANPEYSLCAVFSNLNFTGISIEKKDNENNVETLFDVARESFSRRAKKTGDAVKLIGKYQNLQIGNKDFVKYEFSTTGGALVAKSAVFVSSIGQFYEFSLIPMNVLGNEIPPKKEFDKIFNSFLAAIQY